MDKTADMYEKIVKDGPFSAIAPQAQMKIGEAREKQENFPDAAKAYETAADRYHDRMPVRGRRPLPRRTRLPETGSDRRIRPKHRRPGRSPPSPIS